MAKLADSNYYYPAVAHCAYYSCMHLMQHIWYHKMNKTKSDLDSECSAVSQGMHAVLINKIGVHIKSNTRNRQALNDFQLFNSNITQLKKLRTNADYTEDSFDITKSRNSIDLAEQLIPILKRA